MSMEKIRESARSVVDRLESYPDIADNELQTKISLIEPILRSLGYDTSHPEQVTLEVETELGGRIDYMLTGESRATIAVEAKRARTSLSDKETKQLRAYFTFSEAVSGILTNGVTYWLFTDLERRNVMDHEPYHRIDIGKVTDSDLHQLLCLSRNMVDKETIHDQARQARYQPQIDSIVAQELAAPSPEFLRVVGKQVGLKPLNKTNLSFLRPLVAASIGRALGRDTSPDHEPMPSQVAEDVDNSTSDPVDTGRLRHASFTGARPAPDAPNASSASAPDAPGSSPKLPSTPGLVPGKKAANTRRRFKGATLFGRDLGVKNYTKMLISVVEELQARHPHSFDDRVRDSSVFKGRRWWKISKDVHDFSPNPSHSKIQVGGYWLHTHLSAKDKVKRAELFLKAFGHSPKDLEIHTSDD